MDKILIEFTGGAHGSFLEFLLNRFYYNADWTSPITDLGTSHAKPYKTGKTKFFCNHFVQRAYGFNIGYCKKYLDDNDDIIHITLSPDDALLLQINAFYRAGDAKIEVDELEHDTYNKLNSRHYYHDLLSNMINAYKLTCSESNPDVPRYILREFFKFGFKDPSKNGFMINQEFATKHLEGKHVYKFPYMAFFDVELLANEINNISKYFNIPLTIDYDFLNEIHKKFTDKIVYLSIKQDCEKIIDAVVNRQHIAIPKLNLLQESYINGRLENIYNKEMPFRMDHYFTNTQQIIEYLNEI